MGHMESKPPSPSGNITQNLAEMRLSYPETPFDLAHLDPDPYRQFSHWLLEAAGHPGITEPNGMVIATVDAAGRPSTRSVLLKGADERGFTFFTNYESKKAQDLRANPNASLTFPWYPLHRQVHIIGTVAPLTRDESVDYFQTRPWGSRIGAWASLQSTPLPDRTTLEERWAHYAELYPEGSDVPTPENWGGYLLRPSEIEFWQGRRSRLHDRLRYEQVNNSQWQVTRYYP
ncbi:pyridoxine/pyridoxamine 5'-phosphate oxidase [mine drainage metagenome]|uniref:Pyridoxine/pyridoxamine 5'-phosphate oxidase n=1 Tax=mine drainage metagenome TaxID=410659 RepID=A0A1J5PGF6_9ZZZZ